MKKAVIMVILALCFVPALSVADVDLANMSYDELVNLKSAIIEEMTKRDDFDGISVPAGQYVVGEDIPAGTYTITLPDNSTMSMCDIDVNDYEQHHMIAPSIGADKVGKIELVDGDVVEITGCTAVFKKYTGLGF